jgi:hypothetical protein
MRPHGNTACVWINIEQNDPLWVSWKRYLHSIGNQSDLIRQVRVGSLVSKDEKI